MDSFHLKVHSVKKINNPQLSNYYILCKCGYFATIFVNFPFELFQNFINILVFISKIAKKKKKKIPHFQHFFMYLPDVKVHSYADTDYIYRV